MTDSINYQGRLTDSSGSPLTGTYRITFRLYDVSTGGTALDTDTHQVNVTDGLFNTGIDFDQSYFDGSELWLGVAVGADSEMTPRQELRPVPYALSLVPGADIIGSARLALYAETTHWDGSGIHGCASATSSSNRGVTGESMSPDGYGGYFYGIGTGVYGEGGKYGGCFTTNQGGASDDHTAGVNATTTHDHSDGVYAETTGDWSNGVYAHTIGNFSYGVVASTTGGASDGVCAYTIGYNSDGVHASASGDDSCGVWAHSYKSYGVYGIGKYGGFFTTNQGGAWGDPNAGVDATTTYDYSHGVRAYTTGGYSDGVHASTTGNYSYGVSADTTGYGSPGVFASTTGVGSDGVYTYSEKSDGVYAVTGRSDHNYGVRTPNKMYASYGYDTRSADVAEYFPTPEDPEPGTVMVIDPAGGSRLRSSAKAYDPTVAGIVSTAPGVSLGTKEDGNDGEKLIAVAGRVPCKVDASYAAIKPGDLLTTSDTRGHAMKATNPVIGTILGKALAPLDAGTGTIEVLVTLQ